MAEAAVQGLTKTDLQEMLQSVIKAMKEPTAEEAVRIQQVREQEIRAAREAADGAKAQEAIKARRWEGCPHKEIYNGRIFWKWQGQVNSDGLVKPVCNICHVEAPPFSATLLPDGGKQGVRFEEWTDPSKERLINLHKQTYPKGCAHATCLVCAKKAA